MMERIKLTEICTPKQWKTIPTSELLEEGFPVYGANGVIGYYSEYNHKESVITITCRGATCGTVNITCPQAYVTGNAMCLDDIRSDISLDYLYYCLLHYDFRDVISGSAQPQITRQGLKKVEVSICDSKKQNEIVSVLKRVETIISARKRELQTLDNLIKARFVEMFGDKFKGSMIKVGDIADVYIGLTYKPENVSEKGTIVLRSGNIRNQSLQVETDVVRVSGVKIADNKYVKDKDILMCARNGSARLVGKSCLIRNPKEEMAFGAFMSVIRTGYPYFLQGFFSSDYFKNQLTNVGTTSVNQITSKMLNNYNVIMPTKGQEEEFSVFCSQVDKSKVVEMFLTHRYQ